MKRFSLLLCLPLLFPPSFLMAQEASAGIDLAATVTGQAVYDRALTEYPRDGAPVVAGFRSMLYPTWKIDDHWTISAAININSRPYFAQDFSTQGFGVETNILNLNIGYSRVWKKSSILIRAGQITSAFGSFLLRYDDAVNPLLDMPMQYGYYYSAVTTAGLPGAQIDATWRKWDGRVQFTNSSPMDPRSIFQNGQYPNWAGGLGYTIRQGLRVGVSAFRGPYLNSEWAFYYPGESSPRDLPASAIGTDVEWARGHWNVQGEWQRFVMTYHVIPTFRENAGYAEARRVLTPRWYVAARVGYLHGYYDSGCETYETVAGFRPNTHQLIKFGYMLARERASGMLEPVWSAELVTTLHPLSMAWN